jgi:hypothetical protein
LFGVVIFIVVSASIFLPFQHRALSPVVNSIVMEALLGKKRYRQSA